MTAPRSSPDHRLKGLSLRQLRCFVAVARLGSFSAAARHLAVSQPALSATIRQIEQQFGFDLFHRTTHMVALSDQGRSILPLAERLLIAADHAFDDMRAAVTHQRLAIRIGAIPSALPMVARAIAPLAKSDPDIDLHVADGRNDELIAGLGVGRFDLIVGIGPAPTDAFAARTIMEDDMVLLAPDDHPLARTGRQPWRALAGHALAHFNGGSIGTLAEAALTAHGLKASKRFRLDHAASLYAVVESGMALGIMSRLYASAPHPHSRIRLVALIEPTVTRPIAVLHRRHLSTEHPRALHVVETLLQAGRRTG
ncbi:MAG: hypothetical protein ABS87_00185 [Sphingomonas sp. SCN 67-18]|uniref:LysR family transcriptional regulator n=1 Tax=uncultured Sphingomonas sp. TaxID=158754 RepID=UPI00086DB3D9|nr:LysR family transcriptional regulator [uncultured Sphingomonas sp.]ODU22856.1 MAG: hypothetical protein ABS87_00185 [Sphingomonas sp. SCN 67-18]